MDTYVISTDRADCLLRAIINAASGALTLRIEKDWHGNVVFYLPNGDDELRCVIRRQNVEISPEGVHQNLSAHDDDLVSLEGHEILELYESDGITTGIFLPRSV